ncbi:MAG: hypothetical protein ACYDD1_08780 [Caulobacteraceae bacterium]
MLPDAADKLVKLYLKPQGDEKVRKLQLLTAGVSEALTRVAAWPIELVTDRQGRTLGFVMPRAASTTQAHELYTPKSRAQAFPEEDFRFVLHVSANIVRAFGTVHQAGYVIGDVNHGQVLVGRDGRVTLIDCDSIQVQTDGQLYTCDVGVPLFTPPELQGRPFRGLLRTADHDRFGLAVLLFQLLFMGRHPYAGVPLNPNGSTEIEAAIKADRFAYGDDRRARGVEQPPGTLPLSTYGPGISSLFNQAFARQPVTTRPNAETWLRELKALQANLKPCANSVSHHYPGHLTTCPWCSIEARTGTRLFGYKPTRSPGQQPLDIAGLWGAVLAVPAPSVPPEPSMAGLKLPRRSAADQIRSKTRRLRQLGALGAGCILVSVLAGVHEVFAGLAIGGATGFVVWPRVRSADRQGALKAEADARAAFEAAQSTWRTAAAAAAFSAIKQRCIDAKASLDRLPLERKARLASLHSEAKQREAYLDGFRIMKGEVPGIGAGRIANLNSFGIETAWDITAQRVEAIPGFGPNTAAKLIAWRMSKEARFRFNPNHPIAAAELNAIEGEFNSRTQQFVAVLRAGPATLQQATSEAEKVLAATGPLLSERWTSWQLAKRQRQDFYDGINTSNPWGILAASVTVLVVLVALLDQAGKTPAVPAAPTQAGNVTASIASMPPADPKTHRAELNSVTNDNVTGLAAVTDNQTESLGPVENVEAQHAGTEMQSAEITPGNTPALRSAISEALNAGASLPWRAGDQSGVVTLGDVRFHQGHLCRSYAYTVNGVTSPETFACEGAEGTDGVWKPEMSDGAGDGANGDRERQP